MLKPSQGFMKATFTFASLYFSYNIFKPKNKHEKTPNAYAGCAAV